MVDWNALAAVAGPVVIAIAAGIFTTLAGSRKNRVDGQAMLNAGFDALVQDHRKERRSLLNENQRLRTYCKLLEQELNDRSITLPFMAATREDE